MNLVSVTEDQGLLTPTLKEENIVEEKYESDDSLSFTSCPIEEDLLFPHDKAPCKPIPQTYDWVKDLTKNNYEVAPVQCFRYVCIDKTNNVLNKSFKINMNFMIYKGTYV